MRMRVLGCSGGSAPARQLSGYLFDDVLAVDAGSLTTALEMAAQGTVEAVAVTHAHLDHVWSFPLFLANRFEVEVGPAQLFADPATLRAVRECLFNDRVWPDFAEIKRGGVPIVEFHPVEPGRPTVALGRYELTAVAMAHTVPSYSYLVRRGGRSVLVGGDTTTTQAVWDLANAQDDLGGVILECSFPDGHESLAVRTGHLSPRLFGAELAKLRKDVPVYATHLKPEHRTTVIGQLRALGDHRVRILEDGLVLEF